MCMYVFVNNEKLLSVQHVDMSLPNVRSTYHSPRRISNIILSWLIFINKAITEPKDGGIKPSRRRRRQRPCHWPRGTWPPRGAQSARTWASTGSSCQESCVPWGCPSPATSNKRVNYYASACFDVSSAAVKTMRVVYKNASSLLVPDKAAHQCRR